MRRPRSGSTICTEAARVLVHVGHVLIHALPRSCESRVLFDGSFAQLRPQWVASKNIGANRPKVICGRLTDSTGHCNTQHRYLLQQGSTLPGNSRRPVYLSDVLPQKTMRELVAGPLAKTLSTVSMPDGFAFGCSQNRAQTERYTVKQFLASFLPCAQDCDQGTH